MQNKKNTKVLETQHKNTFSILIVNYNYQDYVEQAILSVLNQEYPEEFFEVIVVDDGSTDESLDVIAKVNSSVSNLRVISQPNLGQAAAFYAAINLASNEWICLLDSDDYFKPEKLSKLNSYINKKQQNCDFICHDVDTFDEVGGTVQSWFSRQKIDGDALLIENAQGGYPFANPCGQVYRKTVLQKIAPWLNLNDWKRGADNPLSWGAMYISGRVCYIHESLAVYRVHGNNFFMSSISGHLSPKINWLERWPKLLEFLTFLNHGVRYSYDSNQNRSDLILRQKNFISYWAKMLKQQPIKPLISQSHAYRKSHLTRVDWLNFLMQICEPVLKSAASGKLKANMPLLGQSVDKRLAFSHLEALGRTLAGIAPWLELGGLNGEEGELQAKVRQLAKSALLSTTDPSSVDFLNYEQGQQPVVDSAYLAQAILRAPETLWLSLSMKEKKQVFDALISTRRIRPYYNNWLLFSAMIEAFVCKVGGPYDAMRIDYAFRQVDQWYVGDGFYSDGPVYHSDYYNSYVIHPFLLDVYQATKHTRGWYEMGPTFLTRAQRYAVLLERMISPEGTMPVTGRSLAYRCGSLHALADLAWKQWLPDELKPAQVRCAMSAVITRTLTAENTFNQDGWLNIGHSGYQPSLAEDYISTGSLYMASLAFLPLGLPPEAAFWSDPDMNYSSEIIYGGLDIKPDAAS